MYLYGNIFNNFFLFIDIIFFSVSIQIKYATTVSHITIVLV